jgi:uncharacterized protein (DUF433 family)
MDLGGQLSNLLSRCTGLFTAVERWRDLGVSADQAPTPRSGRPVQRQRRLSPEEAERLVGAYRKGVSVGELARSFGQHRSTVSAILDRHRVSRRPKSLSPEQAIRAV